MLRVQAAVAVTKAEQELLTSTARITAVQGAAKLEQVGMRRLVLQSEKQPWRHLYPPTCDRSD